MPIRLNWQMISRACCCSDTKARGESRRCGYLSIWRCFRGEEIAKVNNKSHSTYKWRAFDINGKKLTPAAFANLEVSPKVRLETSNPTAFLAKKEILDTELKKDFDFIVEQIQHSPLR